LKTKRHVTRGWLKVFLTKHNFLKEGNEALLARVMSDYQCLAIEVMKSIQASDFKDPRLVSQPAHCFQCETRREIPKKKTGVPTGVYTMPYLLHAFDVSESSFKRN
jgi:hypothetical protein